MAPAFQRLGKCFLTLHKDACDGKTGSTYVEPLLWSICSDGCQFGSNESEQACDAMDGDYTYIPANQGRCVNAEGVESLVGSKIECREQKQTTHGKSNQQTVQM